MSNDQITNKFFLPAVVILVGLFIVGAVLWNGSQTPSINIKNVKTDGDPFIGQASAPVTIAEWSDYQCTYCKRFELETLPQIVQNYVNTGKVKIVYLDFAFLGNDSIAGALYGRAVWKLYPSLYFAWREAMYNAQDEEGDKGFGNAASIDKLDATIAGIDAAKVAADVKANANVYQAAMDADKIEAGKVGVNATPSFVIGTQMIAGAVPYATLQTAIDAVSK